MRILWYGIVLSLAFSISCNKKEETQAGGDTPKTTCTKIKGPGISEQEVCGVERKTASGSRTLFFGDIDLSRSGFAQGLRGRNAFLLPSVWSYYFWDLPIPYTIDSSLNVAALEEFIIEIETQTGMNIFVPRTSEVTYLSIEAITDPFELEYSCGYSGLGRGYGKNILRLNPDCQNRNVFKHELGHSLGFWHEQQRYDRDEFVSIVQANIIPGFQGEFSKLRGEGAYYGPFDFLSLMIYDPFAFTMNGFRTMVANTSTNDALLEQAIDPEKDYSANDVAAIKTVYDLNLRDEVLTVNSTKISFHTAAPQKTKIYYGLSSSTMTQVSEDPVLVTDHEMTLTGLTADTEYFFSVLTGEVGGVEQLSVFRSFITDLTNPQYTEQVSYERIGSEIAATIRSDEETAAYVGFYSDLDNFSDLTYYRSDVLGKIHYINFTLPDDADYQVFTVLVDRAGNENFDDEVTISNHPLILNNLAVSNRSESGFRVTWTTNRNASTRVYYGTDANNLDQMKTIPGMRTSHSVDLTGLAANTKYFFKARSVDAAVFIATGTGSASTDVTAPSISNIATSGSAHDKRTVTWTTNESSSSRVDYAAAVNGSCSGVSLGSNVSNGSMVTSHSLELTGLSANTKYCFTVTSADAVPNSATSGVNEFTTPSNSDTLSYWLENHHNFPWLVHYVHVNSSMAGSSNNLTIEFIDFYWGPLQTQTLTFNGTDYKYTIPYQSWAERFYYGYAYFKITSSKGTVITIYR